MIELESSLDEDEDSYFKQALWGVIDEVKAVKKKEDTQCKFCTSKTELETIKDYVVNYSSIVYCVVNHCEGEMNVRGRDLFDVEMYMLNFMVDPENMSVYKSIKGEYTKYEKIRKTIGILSEKYFSNNVNVLECEHDVESLTLMLYKKYEEKFKSEDIEYLLTILYLRKEYTRFFRIFRKITPSIYETRLALSLTFNEDCDFQMKQIDQTPNLPESYTGLKGSEDDELLQDIISIVNLNIPNTEEWLKEAKTSFEWSEKVKIWSKNRHDCSGSVDRSMLDEAIRSKRWDDGWYIYKLGSKGVKEDFHKTCILCIKALIHEKDELWVSRLLDVLGAAIDMNQVEVCCDIIDDLFDRMDIIDEKYRLTIVREFIRKVSKMEDDERVVNHVIRVISRLCRTCNGSEACGFCIDHVNYIYSVWKKNNTGGFFFKHHSKYESEIFENMLDLYCTIDDSGKFVGVCKDLVENEAKLNKEMCKRIQSVHKKTCGGCCKFGDTRAMKVNGGEDLLSHLFNNYSSCNE